MKSNILTKMSGLQVLKSYAKTNGTAFKIIPENYGKFDPQTIQKRFMVSYSCMVPKSML